MSDWKTLTVLIKQKNWDAVFPLVYNELEKRARGVKRQDGTLDTRALIHELYLDVVSHTGRELKDRNHFFAVAVIAMHRILIDDARKKAARMRGGDGERPPIIHSLDEMSLLLPQENSDEIECLKDALRYLARLNGRSAQVVVYRYYNGMTIEETAKLLNISQATVKRDWDYARTWLYRQVKRCLNH